MAGSNFFPLILISFFLFSNLSKWVILAQYLPPARYDGFLYLNRDSHADSHAVVIEAFFDPVCPDSRDSWPPLKQALLYYGSRTSFVLHLLPLPYHDNAYVASRALHIANLLNSSSTFPLLEHFFKNQERFYNAQTRNISRVDVVKQIVEFASVAIGNSYYSAIEAGLNDRQTDLLTRVSFKYSASRGVFGTPTFLVNGFVLSDSVSPSDYNGWRKVLDPLVKAKSHSTQPGVHLS